MDTKIISEVLACLCGERTVFSYHRDAYVTYLLQRAIADKSALTLKELRKSRWARLLNKPLVRDILADCGNGYLHKEQLNYVQNGKVEPFVLTLDTWGNGSDYRWNQISRPGANLVLQLNLSSYWHNYFHSLVKESANDFIGYSHPLSKKREMTLAWARIDFDFDTNEALIEEIQTDLVRVVGWMQERAKKALARKSDHFHHFGVRIMAEEFCQFADAFLCAFKHTWHEAMLTAALSFAFDEIGIAHLYYHTFETGSRLKNITHTKPPRSLYRDLPQKFCFRETDVAPMLLKKDRRTYRKLKKIKDSRWFHMAA